MIEFINRYGAEMIQHSMEHLYLVTVAIFIAIIVGIPLGILVTLKPKLRKPILGFANIMQTIPSLALFGLLIPVPVLGGIGDRTAIIALTLYSLLPIIRNTYTGIIGVDPAIREAGKGMGMTDMQLLLQVEIPLALGVILAGVRAGRRNCDRTRYNRRCNWRWWLGSIYFSGRCYSQQSVTFCWGNSGGF